MLLDPYHTASGELCAVSAEQGHQFAKGVAEDFNPLHDADNSRFCVPGDLLFALVLMRQGLSQSVRFHFEGMAGADMPMRIPTLAMPEFSLIAGDKVLAQVTRAGALNRNQAVIEQLVCHYVRFSGRNFPHILVPLMEQHELMINPDRPLVIYEGMSFELDSLERSDLELVLLGSRLEIAGKRAKAHLDFEWRVGAQPVGRGAKTLVLGGLRPLEPAGLQGLVERYDGWRASYLATRPHAP
ncbi:MAG: DUF3581 family protein [Thiohalocapsa sp.]